MTDKKANTITT